jgi:hypothetical protein
MSATVQPTWELLANLGDVNPLDHGGYFVYRDTTGSYPEEAEYLEVPDDDTDPESDGARWTVYRFGLDKCMAKPVRADNAVYLVPASYRQDWPHPLASYDEWFHKDLARVASFIGSSLEELRADFCKDDPIARAWAYRAIGEYYGFVNLDSYPLSLTRDEAAARYGGAR